MRPGTLHTGGAEIEVPSDEGEKLCASGVAEKVETKPKKKSAKKKTSDK